MVAYRKTTYFYIIWCCHILGPESFSDGYSFGTRQLSVKRGGSVTIPCYYDRKYTQQKKFWYSEYDNIRIYTNTTAGDVTVIDDPAQSLFTVTMRNLKGGHNGTYYCAVETGEQPKTITTDEPHLHVQPAPDLSVMSSSVTVDEGVNISLQCLYNTKYKNKNKQWCRYKDKRCYTSQNASVEISDDMRGSLTVVMSGLMKSDSGWYYCSVNVQQSPVQDLLVPVQLTVKAAATPDISTESNKTETENNTKNTIPAVNEQQPSAVPLWLPVSVGLLLLMILVGVFIWKWKRRSDSNVDTTYCVVEDPSGHKAQVPADGTLYSTVEPHYQNPQEQ
ncbi:polymeric immunoglobulin receptor-like isoform X1 [Misgurnus anguillicaudatus]|uniref:polymeric immunoglobulin receptor-like isoform X1 n=1 Tax=Misgurnus anguillicaudatus TaxID=75329 RepID=UPI003CCF6FA4